MHVRSQVQPSRRPTTYLGRELSLSLDNEGPLTRIVFSKADRPLPAKRRPT